MQTSPYKHPFTPERYYMKSCAWNGEDRKDLKIIYSILSIENCNFINNLKEMQRESEIWVSK